MGLIVGHIGGSLKKLYFSEPVGELLTPSDGREWSLGAKALLIQKLVKY